MIKNLGAGRYKVVVRIKNKKREATISGSKLDAQKKELEMKITLKSEFENNNRSLKSQKFTKFSECLEVYRERSQWKPAVFERLLKELGHSRLDSGDTGEGIWENLEDFVEYLKQSTKSDGKPYSPAYINRHIAQAKAAVKLAYRPLRKIPYNYLEGFPTERENNIRYRILTNSERERLYNALPVHMKPIFYFACRVPTRAGELVNLKKSNIDYARNLILLDDGSTKNGCGRWLPIFPEFRPYIESIPEGCDFLFYKERKGNYYPLGYHSKKTNKIVPDFTNDWHKACKEAGIDPKEVNWHKTRQQASMQLLYDGWNQMEVMSVGGWLTLSAFRRYAKIDEVLLMKRLGNFESDDSWKQKLAPK